MARTVPFNPLGDSITGQGRVDHPLALAPDAQAALRRVSRVVQWAVEKAEQNRLALEVREQAASRGAAQTG